MYICNWTALYNFANNVWTNLISESTTPLYIQVMKVLSWYLYVLFIVIHSFDRDKYPVYGSYHVGWGSKWCSEIVVSFFLKTLLMTEIYCSASFNKKLNTSMAYLQRLAVLTPNECLKLLKRNWLLRWPPCTIHSSFHVWSLKLSEIQVHVAKQCQM